MYRSYASLILDLWPNVVHGGTQPKAAATSEPQVSLVQPAPVPIRKSQLLDRAGEEDALAPLAAASRLAGLHIESRRAIGRSALAHFPAGSERSC